jgi:hypothetical protein
MVTSEGNRTQEFQSGSVTEQHLPEQRVSVSVRDPFWFMSLVASGATIASMWGLSALVLSIIGLSGVLPMYLLPVAGIVLGASFLMLGMVDIAWARMFRFPEHENSRDRILFFSGVSAVLIAGFIAVILNILNFLGDVRFVAVGVILDGTQLALA